MKAPSQGAFINISRGVAERPARPGVIAKRHPRQRAPHTPSATENRTPTPPNRHTPGHREPDTHASERPAPTSVIEERHERQRVPRLETTTPRRPADERAARRGWIGGQLAVIWTPSRIFAESARNVAFSASVDWIVRTTVWAEPPSPGTTMIRDVIGCTGTPWAPDAS